MPTSKVNQSEHSKHDCEIIAFYIYEKIDVMIWRRKKMSCVVLF